MPISQPEIDQYFQQHLGRAATPPEIEYLNRIGKEGNLGAFELGQIIQSLPEAQQRQIQTSGSQIEGALAGGDQRFLQRAGDTLQSQFYQQGRPASSGYTAAYFNAARDLGIQRQNILGQYYAGAYGQQPNQAYAQGQQTTQQGLQEKNTLRQRGWDIADYNRQQADFQNFYNQQRKNSLKSSLWGRAVDVVTPSMSQGQFFGGGWGQGQGGGGGGGGGMVSGFSKMFGG